MKWNIICDSSCDLFLEERTVESVFYSSVPFLLNVGDVTFYDDENLNTKALVNSMKDSKTVSHTACPSPLSWLERMIPDGNNICVTISKNLSGSYDSAVTAAKMLWEEHPETNIAVIDSCATGPAAVLAVRKVTQLIENGKPFGQIVSETESYISQVNTCFALASFDNLVKSGRISKLSGVLAKTLELWGIGVQTDGKIAVKAKTRGKKRALSALINTMKENGLCGGEVVICHCRNITMAHKLSEEIKSVWSEVHVTILPTRGLNSYYAEDGGIIVSY